MSKTNKTPRPISDILIEADEATELTALEDLYKEVIENRYSYPLVEWEQAEDCLKKMVMDAMLKDFDERFLKKYLK